MGAPTVLATTATTAATISGSVTLSGFENAAAFTADHKLAFGTAIAETLGADVKAAQVAVTVAEVRRRLGTTRVGRRLGTDLVVSYIVSGLTADQATAAKATITATTPATFLTTLTTKMTAQNVTPPTGMEVAAISTPTAAIAKPDAAAPTMAPTMTLSGASSVGVSSLAMHATCAAVWITAAESR